MESRITGSQPPKRVATSQVLRCLDTNVHQYTILSTSVWGQLIHFSHGRSSECLADMGDCQRCADNQPQKWLGYLDVIDHHENCRGFLELTATAAHLLINQVPKGENLRGLVVRMNRTRGGKKGRFVIHVLERREAVEKLPDDANPIHTLRFLWNCKPGYRQTM